MNPKDVLLKWVEYMNSHQADKLGELYHQDAENLQVAIGTPLVGRPAIVEDFQSFFKSIPDTFTRVENVFEDGEWAILEWSGGGTFQSTGRSFALRGCGFFKIQQGQIIFQRGYWDKATWYGQVGLPMESQSFILLTYLSKSSPNGP